MPFFQFVLENPDKPWDWKCLSKNPKITMEIVAANPEKPWNWYWLSSNPNITWEFVAANPEKPWDWGWLSRNPNITWEIVAANPDKPWDWHWLSGNTFKIPNTEAFKKKKAKEVADLCREGIMKYCWNPERPLGRYLVMSVIEEDEAV